MADFQLTDVLLPYQKAIALDQSRFICILASRQVGKSFTLAARAVLKSLLVPKNLTVLVSVNLRSSMELLKKAVQWAEAAAVLAPTAAKFTASATQIQFANGSRIVSLPAKPESLRGFSGDVILDEAAMFQDDREIFAAVLPIISNGQCGVQHTLAMSSTPRGVSNKFAQVFLSDDPSWSKHKITIDDAAAQGLKVDISQLRNAVNDDDIWNQEYMCSFSSSSGQAFSQDDISKAISDSISPSQPSDFFLGMDIGRTSDKTSIAVISKSRTTQEVTLAFLQEYSDMPFRDQLSELKEVFTKFKQPFGLIDRGGIGMQLAEDASRLVSPRLQGHSFTMQSKAQAYALIRQCLQDSLLKIPREYSSAVSENLQGVQKLISRDGQVKIFQARSSSGHCDSYSALSLAFLAMSQHPAVSQLPAPARLQPSSFGHFSRRRFQTL